MALISPTIPTIGQPNSTEDQDIVNALNTIVSAINGGLDNANIAAAAGVTAAQLAAAVQAAAGLNGSSTRRGKCIVATEESTTSTSYTTLTTPDRVSNIVMPTDGLIFVAYQAMWKSTVAGMQSQAAIFLGANQLKAAVSAAAPTTQSAGFDASGGGAAGFYTNLHSSAVGLSSDDSRLSTSSTAPVTTGQVAGAGYASEGDTRTDGEIALTASQSGICAIFAAAGTYDISVQFKTASGTVTAKERKLWVWSNGFD